MRHWDNANRPAHQVLRRCKALAIALSIACRTPSSSTLAKPCGHAPKARCLILDFDGAFLSHESKDAHASPLTGSSLKRELAGNRCPRQLEGQASETAPEGSRCALDGQVHQGQATSAGKRSESPITGSIWLSFN